jgi:gliding motility-associated-like protein
VILDANAAMINFEIVGGAIPTGSMFYQINCGPQVAVGSPICITGTGPHHITFCKPGNNENIYRITSIPKPTFPTDDTVRIGCVSNLQVLGLETSSVTWQSIFPGTAGQYDSYLSCTNGCTNPTYTPPTGAPAFVDYKICGFPIADECGFVGQCDTIRIYNFGTMTGSVSPSTGTFCAGGSGVTLTASASGGDGNYSYIWRDPNGNIVGNAANYQAATAGTFSVEIRDGLYDPALCPPVTLGVPVVQVSPPTVNAGTDQIHCADNPTSILNATIANCTNVNWTGGNGIYNPSSTGTTVIYTPTAAEILSGSVTLTATSIGAGGGCAESTDQITLTFPPDISVNITTSSVSCYGNNSTINATVTGGAGNISYQWNTGAVTPSISVTAGNFCVNVVDAIGCYATTCSNVIAPDPMTISLSSTDATAGNNGTTTASVTGGTLPYSYTWYTVPVQNTQTAIGLGTGMYTVVVTDANGCSISSSVIVNNAFCSGLQASASSSNITCYGDANGMGVATATGGTPQYSYSWQPPLSGTNDTIEGLTAGTYLVFVTDQNGCTDAATITIIEPLQMVNVMNHTDVSVAGGNDGTATANVSGGVLPYGYSWETSANTVGISNLTSGTYSLLIVDGNNCKLQDSVLINEPNCTDFIIGVSSTPVSCNNGSDGSASVVVLNGDAPFTYTWSNGGTSTSINGITAGTYVINVEDAIGCNTFQSITITEPSPLSVTLAATQPSCASVNNGNIELIVSGGTYPFTFNWSNGATSEDLFGIAPGNYSVLITDDNNCTNTQSTSITYPTAMTSSVSLTNVTCHDGNDGAINLTASGGTGALSYLWSNGATTQDISGLSSGLYSVTVSDQNGCNNSIPISIFINEPDDVTNAYTTYDCPVPGSGVALVTVHPSGGSLSNYQVSFDNGATFQDIGDYDALLPVGNIYNIIILDSNACVSPIADVITINPEVTVADIDFEKCFLDGDNLTLVTVTPQGGFTPDYTISLDNGGNYLPLGDYDDSLAIGNSYDIIVQDTAGCLSVSYTINIPSEMLLSESVSVFTNDNISCIGMNDGAIDITIIGGTTPYSYDWSNGETTEDVSGLMAGNYSLTITDSNGCAISDSYTLTEPDSLLSVLTITSDFNGHDVSCFASEDGTVDASTTGGSQPYDYSWSNGDLNEDIANLGAGTYSVTITDNNGCVFTDDITLNRPDTLSSSDVIDDVLCNGFFNGAVDLSVNGGVSPYSYDWSNGDQTEDITDLGPGTYTVTITDDNGCILIHSSTVIELNPIVVSTSVSHVLCNGDSNGSIDLTVDGGTIPYVFIWSDGSLNEDIWDLTTGSYSVLITDANGCTYDDTIDVTQPDTLTATVSSPVLSNGHNISFYQGNDGTVDVTVTGGTASYVFDWSNGSNTEDLSALTAGTYSLTITDENGCTYSLSIDLDEPFDLQLPQGFSPNNDEKNDLFHILGLEAYPINIVTVFNRWGNEVFKANDYANDWDGTFSKTGDKLPDGTYFVILEIDSPEEIRLKGYVEIRK